MEEYKVGDKVRVIPRTKTYDEYPFGYVDPMLKYVGKIFEIEEIRKAEDDSKCTINGDYHKYILKNCHYWWHSSMFEKVEACSNISIKTESSGIIIKQKSKIFIVL